MKFSDSTCSMKNQITIHDFHISCSSSFLFKHLAPCLWTWRNGFSGTSEFVGTAVTLLSWAKCMKVIVAEFIHVLVESCFKLEMKVGFTNCSNF